MNNAKKQVKRFNQLRIFKLIQNEGEMSRKTIADKLHLTRSSITQLTTELIEIGMLFEAGSDSKKKTTAGPREKMLSINEGFKYLLGIDIEINQVTVGLVTLTGKTMASSTFDFDLKHFDAKALGYLVESIKSSVNKVIREKNLHLSDVLYCGVGIVGRERYYEARDLDLPPLLGLKEELLNQLQAEIDIPIDFENNVRSLALAELVFHQTEQDDSFLYIKVGPGIGSAIVLNKHLYRGARNAAGEMGSSNVTEFYPNSDRKIFLEDIISTDFIKDEIKNNWGKSTYPALFEKVDGDLNKVKFRDINFALENGDQELQDIFRTKVKILSYRIVDYVTLLDIEKVYIFLSTDICDFIKKILTEEIRKISKSTSQKVKLSHIDRSQTYTGGAALAYINGMDYLENMEASLESIVQ